MAYASYKKRTNRFKKGDRLTASWAQKVENFISTFHVLAGGHFIFDGETAALQINQNIQKFAFGIKSYDSDAGIVTLREGIIGFPNARIFIDETEINVSGSPAFIVLTIDIRLQNASWLSNTVSSVPANTPTTKYIPYYEFRLTGNQTAPTLYLTHYTGSYNV